MRHIGTLDRESDARQFAAYLITEGIVAHEEQDGDGWAIWVRDENHVETAKDAFVDFRRDPDASRYQGVERAADSIVREEAKRRDEARKNVVQMRGKWGQPGSRRRPLVFTLIALSVVVGLASKMGQLDKGTVMRSLLFIDRSHIEDPSVALSLQSPEGRLIDVRKGQLWRLVTPIFVHYGAMHLAFNMIMFYQLGSVIEDRRGTWRLGMMILLIAAVSNTVQALAPLRMGGAPLAAGMSGVVYGLFGYIWMKSVYAPELGMLMHRSTVFILMLWLFLGISGVLAQMGMNIANWTHGVGFLMGIALGYGPEVIKTLRGS